MGRAAGRRGEENALLEVREEAMCLKGFSAEDAAGIYGIGKIVRRVFATFIVLPCCNGSAKGNIAMRTIAAYYFHAALYRLRRNPVLTAMMVYSVVFGAVVLMAAFAVWRASSSCPIPRWSEPRYVVQISSGYAGRSDPLVPALVA
jgi:hypothetical protein